MINIIHTVSILFGNIIYKNELCQQRKLSLTQY